MFYIEIMTTFSRNLPFYQWMLQFGVDIGILRSMHEGSASNSSCIENQLEYDQRLSIVTKYVTPEVDQSLKCITGEFPHL
jgi:hypothetical protein